MLGILAIALLLLGGSVAAMLAPRWGAMQCLMTLGAPMPDKGALPAGMELVEGAQALGFEQLLIARPDGGGARSVLLFVTGIVDEDGLENPRILQAADAFRKGGHIVVVPRIVMFCDPGRDSDDLGTLVEGMRRVAAGDLPGSRRGGFGVIGISLGGTLAMRALAHYRRDGGRGCRALLTVGAPANLFANAIHWFTVALPPEPERDDAINAAAFARNVLFRAALPTGIRHAEDRAILKRWLDESWTPEAGPEGLSTSEAQMLADAFLGGPDEWATVREGVLRHAWARMVHSSAADWPEEMVHLEGVPVFLLHGVHDPLIPVAAVDELGGWVGQSTPVSVLRSELVGHAEVSDVSWGEKLRHIVFLDDFFDLVGE